MDDITGLIVGAIIVAILIVPIYKAYMRGQGQNTPQQGSETPRRAPVAHAGKVVEDIRMTQTSRIADAVSVLDDLDATHPGYRQYAELVGTTQQTSSVTAPYSKRGVAYYDLRAFRVENVNGLDSETLVAHEKSIEPFYFTDGSCDTQVYVDLDSFGDNIILVNSANRIEGPKSEFSQAFGATASGSGGFSSAVTAMVGKLKSALESLRPQPTLQPALALAGTSGVLQLQRTKTFLPVPATRHDAAGGFAYDGLDLGGLDIGDTGHLGNFLGSDYDPSFIGGPQGNYWGGRGSDASDVLIGMGLGALVGSLANDMAESVASQPSSNQFRGYRIVEDVVPLNQPVYVLGELYKNGTAYTMGRSVSTSYPSSFFATKPEAEVIAHLNNR